MLSHVTRSNVYTKSFGLSLLYIQIFWTTRTLSSLRCEARCAAKPKSIAASTKFRSPSRTIQRHVGDLVRMGKRGELDLTDLQRARLRSFSNDIADLVTDLEALEAAEPIRSDDSQSARGHAGLLGRDRTGEPDERAPSRA